jgi:F-type H+-transporting ATPase subunit a
MDHPATWQWALGIPELWASVVTGLFVMGILLVLGVRAKAAMATEEAIIPDAGLTPRNVFELLVEGIGSLSEQVIGHGSKVYVPTLCTFFIFILTSNLLGLVPGFIPPTSDFDITLALGVCSFLIFNYYGLKVNGMDYIKHLMGPILALAPLIFLLELIGVLVRPVSLALRLFGNMSGDHLVLDIFIDLTYLFVPVIFYMLGTLVSVIQAFVFTLLSMIYIGLSVAHDEGH